MRIVSKKYPKGVRVSGIIFSVNKDRILLMERFKNGRHYFVFPGGGLEDTDKSKTRALKREIKEETNTKIKVICQPYMLNIIGHSKQFFYVCQYLSGEISLSGEEKKIQSKKDRYLPKWFKIEELNKIDKLYPVEIKEWLLSDLKMEKWIKRRLVVASPAGMKT